MKVAIVGGGIAGLAAAYALEKQQDVRCVLLEGSARLGGKLQTDEFEGFRMEAGPDCVFARKPWAVELMQELGLADEMIEPRQNEFQILSGGKLHAMPRRLASLMCSDIDVLSSATFLSEDGRKRAAEEPSIKGGDGSDESIASFFRRRFGDEFAKKVAEPLLAGTHAGDPSTLSMAALYPTYLERERKSGSLSGQAFAPAPPGGPQTAMFVSLRTGMVRLVNALSSRLSRTEIRLSSGVRGLHRFGGRVTLPLSTGAVIDADSVILACSSAGAAVCLSEIAPDAAEELSWIKQASSTIVTLGFRAESAVRMTGTGFLTATDEPSVLTGCTWSSNKWENRAPIGAALVRAFVGRTTGSDEELSGLALEELRGLGVVDAEPFFTKVTRWDQALPLYELGHVDRIDRIEASLDKLPISLAGCSYRGAGVPDAIEQGLRAANRAFMCL